ncbi:patellin-3-like [Neltuma alba]|uniref:patellin-3-like n=1 Tax=Neltuma alba TaxID=207710 RepID=UPI0010A41D14|nr:patellin-3-like [Prosopis alba]
MADEDSKAALSVTEKNELEPPKVTTESDSANIASASAVESDSATANTENTDLPTPPLSESLAAEATSVVETKPPPPPPTSDDNDLKAESSDSKEDAVGAQDERSKKLPQNLVSFKEESNLVGDLSDSQRNALEELKKLVREALDTHQFTSSGPTKTMPAPTETTTAAKEAAKVEGATSESDASMEVHPPPETKIEENPVREAEEVAKETSEEHVFIWGVPLLKDDRSDVILLKFLRARDFKVKDAFVMIKNTISWRKEFNIDALVDEDLGDDLEKVVFMHGYDREGHPVCYNVYGEFQNKELYQKTFSDEEKRAKFLRWRIQFLERSIRKLDFTPGGVNTIFQVNDLKNSPGPGKRELRIATKQALQLLQDNYPEFVAKQVFINVPWWYLAFYTMISPFMTQRTKSKFVFAGPSKSAETLFKYSSPEQVPIQYGGLSVDLCECNPEFSMSDPVTEIPIKPTTKQTVEIIIYEKCIIVWELRVVGWEVSYSAEFKPDAKDGYTVIIQKATKMSPTDEPVVSNSYKVGELGKILLTIDNSTLKKKRLLYRFKIKPLGD